MQSEECTATHKTPDFLAGVIEGFYGPPWSQAERLELFDWMAGWGLNTHLYAPKDDLKHRAVWREPYSSSEAESLGQLIRACQQRCLHFIYALSPGLDIRYSHESELDCLRQRLAQMLALGAPRFALLFDDIPDRLDSADLTRWGSLAAAQCHVANTMFLWTRERQLGGEGYLATIGRELSPGIDVFWTGPEIISREITVAHVQEVQAVLRRKPLIWDNLHANDYDGRRFFCGPYAGRPPELRPEVAGLLSNPNCEFPLNYVPLRTFVVFAQSNSSWDSRKAYLSAMREWLPHFAAIGQPITLEDLVLFADCHYLPHEEGPEAEAFYQRTRGLLRKDPAEWGAGAAAFRRQAARLRECCARMTELRNRPLFHALSRRVWELREELDLLERYVGFKSVSEHRDAPCRSDFHLPGTYRGGDGGASAAIARYGTRGNLLGSSRGQRSAIPAVSQRPTDGLIMNECVIRRARPGDEPGAYHVCLKTGDFGQDGEPFYREDPDALGRIFVGPYLAFEPELSLILEDDQGVCGYALGTSDSCAFYARYEAEWRPDLCARFPAPRGDPSQWTRVQQVYDWYHHPDYFCPEPYDAYPAHLHIDLLSRAQGRGYGRRMLEQVMDELHRRGSPGAHLGVSMVNTPAFGFYERLGFRELIRVGAGTSGCIYMGKSLRD